MIVLSEDSWKKGDGIQLNIYAEKLEVVVNPVGPQDAYCSLPLHSVLLKVSSYNIVCSLLPPQMFIKNIFLVETGLLK